MSAIDDYWDRRLPIPEWREKQRKKQQEEADNERMEWAVYNWLWKQDTMELIVPLYDLVVFDPEPADPSAPVEYRAQRFVRRIWQDEQGRRYEVAVKKETPDVIFMKGRPHYLG